MCVMGRPCRVCVGEVCAVLVCFVCVLSVCGVRTALVRCEHGARWRVRGVGVVCV